MSYNQLHMKMDIIETTTNDGLIYKGILTTPEKSTDKIILHIHGMSGDIYTNSFYPFMYQQYPESGISFLAVEHRGTHSITQFNTVDGKVKNIGNAYEIFEDSSLDIDAWVNKVIKLGYKDIWLQAHSLGPSKVAYYVNNHKYEQIKGLVWLSPSDMIGLVQDLEGIKDHKLLLPEAEMLVSKGKGNEILSRVLWGSIKFSAATYLNFFGNNAKTAIFNYDNTELGWDIVNNIDLPVIAFTGTKDDGIVPVLDAYKAMEKLQKELIKSPRKKLVVFDGAQHDFEGFGQNIVNEVINFIKEDK